MYLNPPACEDDWEITEGAGTFGGQFVAAESLAECLSQCLANPDCVAIDASTQAPFFCFLHDNQSLQMNENYANPVISQYLLIRRCAGTCRISS